MTRNPDPEHLFAEELDALVNRYAELHRLSAAAVVGVLQMKIYLIFQELLEDSDQ
jgi:hypothetical protein